MGVQGFELGRGEITEAGVLAARVVPSLDPFEDRQGASSTSADILRPLGEDDASSHLLAEVIREAWPQMARRSRRRRWFSAVLSLCVATVALLAFASLTESNPTKGYPSRAVELSQPETTPEAAPTKAAPPEKPGKAPLPLFRGKRGGTTPVVYLTFDDGPSRFTPQVVKQLDQANAQATFFMIGQEVVKRPDIAGAAVRSGNAAANHTHNHPNLTKVSDKRFTSQITRAQDAIIAATGQTPTCLRAPMGALDKKTEKRAYQDSLRLVQWTIDSADWKGLSAAEISRRVLSRVSDGAIVLMHDGGGDRSQTVKALKSILPALAQRGYQIRALPECR